MKIGSIFRFGLIPWLFVVVFLFFDVIVRNAPSFMSDVIMSDFGVTGAYFGVLGSMFAYPYSLMQIPMGMFMDRYGPLKVTTMSVILVSVGTALVGTSSGFYGAVLGRFLTGIGSASAFISVVYVCTTYFPTDVATSLTSLSNISSVLGSLVMSATTYRLLEIYSWREIHVYYAIIAASLAVVGLSTIMLSRFYKSREVPVGDSSGGNNLTWANISSLFKRDFVLNAFSAAFFFINTGVFTSMWAPIFFKQTTNFGSSEIALLIFLFHLGWIAGDIIVGALCYGVSRSKIVSVTSFLAIFVTFFLFYVAESLLSRQILMFAMGLLSSGEIVQFNIASQYSNKNNLGLSISFTNCFVALLRAIMACSFGYALDFLTDKYVYINGVVQYPASTWHIVTIIFPMSFALAFIFNLIRKD